MPARVAPWGLAAYMFVLGLIALWPVPVDRPVAELLPKALRRLHRWGIPRWVDYGFVESAANVILFVPLGALVLWLLGWPYGWAGPAAGLLVSSLMELGQFLFLPARYPSLADVAANTFGAALGTGLALLAMARSGSMRKAPPARTL